MFGGEHEARTPLDDKLMALDLTYVDGQVKCGGWRVVEVSKGNPPSARFGHGQAAIGSNIYVFGGREGTAIDERLLDDMHMFDTLSRTWQLLSTRGPSPTPRSYHRVEVVDRFLFVFGGADGSGRLADLHRFDTRTNEWAKLADGSQAVSPIEGRGGPNLIASSDGKKLFVIGGFSGQEMGDVHVYGDGTWVKTATNLKICRSVCVSCRIGRKLVVFGGEVEPSDMGHAGAGSFQGDLVIMEEGLDKMEDVEVSEGPAARGWSAGGAWRDGGLVVVGGLTGDDDHPVRLADVWIAIVDSAKIAVKN